MIKVLIVEDDPMVAEFNRRYLEQVGGFVLTAIARSVNEALELMDKQEIDLILLDIFMPGMNGLELLAKIREMGKGIDVIVVSAACDSHSIKKALQYGAVDYLIKPFEFERFNAALSAYREWVSLTKNRESLSQADLDQLILKREQPQTLAELPKGLDRNTLKKVWKNIQAMNCDFSTEEMANQVGISRVSLRKYLEFLNELGVLNVEVTYGAVGRPVYKYRCNKPKSNFIERYL